MAELILNRYKSMSEAGKGGFGTVIVAWDTRMRRKVAIKQIELSETASKQVDEAGEHWEDNIPGLSEARTAAMIQDANIVTVHDFEIEGNKAYIIMEYVEGLTLTQFLNQYSDDMTLDMLTCIFNGVSHAIEVAHSENVLHLDIKPDNVLIDSKGKVKVTDFGLATLADEFGYGTANAGTIGYMPPEQMRRQALDVRTDLWSLACVTYEMLCGVNPFDAKDIQLSLQKCEDASLTVPSACWEDIPEEIDDAIFRALSPKKEERFSTVSEFSKTMMENLSNPRAGQRQLSALFRDKDDEEEQNEQSNKSKVLENLTNNIGKTIFGRLFAALITAPIAILSCANISLFADPNINILGIVAICALIATAIGWPPLGFALSSICLSAALAMSGNYIFAIVLALISVFWCIYNFKKPVLNTNCTGAFSLFGCFGFSQAGPFLCGLFCDIKESIFNTIYAFLVCLILAGIGSKSLIGWEPFVYNYFLDSSFMQGAIDEKSLGMLSQISTWIWLLSWLICAVIISISCNFKQRWVRIFAVVLGIAIMIIGICLANYFDSDMLSWQPQGWEILPTIAAGSLAVIVAIFLPNRS